ncbi:MAG TPA: SurA N-terminal domain-containing protein [Anaerolineae bacterium]|nr:SurA N-terminal domain-containing protein [Anaerolineae bacterium]
MSKTNSSRNVQIPKEQTRKQLSRAERDAQQSRNVMLVVGGVVAVLVLILGYGFLRENVLILNEPVANVKGGEISTRDFQNRVRLTRLTLQQQAARANAIGDQQSAQQYQQQLDDTSGLGAQVLSGMVDELLLKQGAADFGVSVSTEEVQTFLEEDLGYLKNPPTPAPTRTPAPTPTVTAPITQTPTPTSTPFPTATPITKEGFDTLYKDQLGVLSSVGLADQDYRKIVELRLLGEKVNAAIASSVPTITEQIKFKYIRIEAADVPTVTATINADGFDKVYQAVISSTFPITTVQASETFDWVPQEEISATTEFGPTIAETLFATPISQTAVINLNEAGTAGYAVFILDKGVQPIGPSFMSNRRQQAQQAWLEARRNPAYYLTWQDRVPTKP